MSDLGRLHHNTPGWVPDGAVFHLRMRAAAGTGLIDASGARATAIIDAARRYHEAGIWHCRLILLMPDHLHAIVAFPPTQAMSPIVKAWKGFLKRSHGVLWQEGYFDHRLRNRREADECWRYIRQNPIRAGLVTDAEKWRWFWSPNEAATPE